MLTFGALKATPVLVPMARPLGTSAATIASAPLLLVEIVTREGVSGRGYAFCYLSAIAMSLVPVAADLSAALRDVPLAPLDITARVTRHFRLPGLAGPLAMLASALDTAVWDACAIAAGQSLCEYLGSESKPIRAYNSNGLGIMPPEGAADEAEALLDRGFRAIKLRLGRSDLADDIATVRAVRRRLPDHIALMVDFNQALSWAEALRRCAALDDEGVYWIEEPIRHDDYRHAALVAQATTTPIQIGENFTGLTPMAAALEAAASDYVMVDLDRIGGVSGWQRAAGLAAAYNRELSSHLFPEVSAHLLAATPTSHWLEYVDWAEPILEEPLHIVDGMAIPSAGPGNGLRWNTDAVARFQLA